MPDSFDRKLLCRLRARLLTLGGDSLSGGDWLPCRPCEDGERSLGGALEEDDKDCAALAWSTTLAPDCERASSLVEDGWQTGTSVSCGGGTERNEGAAAVVADCG